MRHGDIIEIALWLDGTETDYQLAHWRGIVCVDTARAEAHKFNLEVGPFTFVEKQPEEDHVPKVPEYISGPNVRLLVGNAPVRSKKPLILKESGFVEDLSYEDREKLRASTRRVLAKRHPADTLSDRNCDQVIEMLGPEVALKTLREGIEV